MVDKAAPPGILISYRLYLDGGEAGAEQYIGDVMSFTPPVLEESLQEYRAGGYMAPVSIPTGINELTCEFTLSEYSEQIEKAFSFGAGGPVNVQVKGTFMRADNTKYGVHYFMSGRITMTDQGEFQSGEQTSHSVRMNLTQYRKEQGSKKPLDVLIDIDVLQHKMLINGRDYYQELTEFLT